MKKILSYSFLASLLLLGACRKSDNPNIPTLNRVPVVTVVVDKTADVSISSVSQAAAAAFKGRFTVDLLFKNDVPPTKVDIDVMKTRVLKKVDGSDSITVRTIRTYKAGLTTFPVTLSPTGTELATLFAPDTTKLGDRIDFGATIYTKDGAKYEAFPLGGLATGNGAGVPGEYGSSTVLATYQALCVFDGTLAGGSYKVLADGWADYSVGDIIQVTSIDKNHVLFVYVTDPGTAQPIIIAVDALNVTSVAKQYMGNYTFPPSMQFFVQSNNTIAGQANNFVAPCDGIISVSLIFTIAAGNIYGTGNDVFKIKKI